VMFILHGTGANGKSTLLGIIKTLLADYAKNCQPDTLTTSRTNGVDNDLARLRGARFVTSIESDEGRRLAEARIKQLTGGDTVTARFLFHEHFEFVPTFKMWLATNHKPEIRGGDEAIWRRLLLIPFNIQIPKPERDLDLPEKLKEELPGILAWAVRGCQRWNSVGLKPPKEVIAATSEYRNEEDRLTAFIDQRCETGAHKKDAAGELYKAYKEWALENGEEPLTSTAFGRRLDEKGYGMKRGRKGRVRVGLSVKERFPGMGVL
jgi:putative DNA primase/helicase